MTTSPDAFRTGAVLASGFIYWIGVLVQAYRLKRRIKKSPNLRPKSLKERLLWMGWLFIISGVIGQPLVIQGLRRTFFFSLSDVLLADSAMVAGLLLLVLGIAGRSGVTGILGTHGESGINRKRGQT